MNPYAYYIVLRMEKVEELFMCGESVNAETIELEFELTRALSKALAERFGMTAREWG